MTVYGMPMEALSITAFRQTIDHIFYFLASSAFTDIAISSSVYGFLIYCLTPNCLALRIRRIQLRRDDPGPDRRGQPRPPRGLRSDGLADLLR